MKQKIDRREFLLASGTAVALSGLPSVSVPSESERVHVVGLKADVMECPLGLENPQPRLSWRLESVERSVRQRAYRLWVGSSEATLKAGRGDLWDSGRVSSRGSFGIRYDGLALSSAQRCWWCVQVWDDTGTASAVSPASWWEMGLLHARDWSAQWLAVEDATKRDDRLAGLQWIWSEGTREKTTRRFRMKFRLPIDASGGELYAVLSDWYFWFQITRLWIDGEPIAGPGHWVGLEPTNDLQRLQLSRQQLALGALAAGEHLVAIEVNTSALDSLSTVFPGGIDAITALAVFLRMTLTNGETLRLTSGRECKTARAQDESGQSTAWTRLDYDDAQWASAQPMTVEGYQPWPAQPAMHLRHEFHTDRQVLRARLYATALGVYEARLNGARVGDAWLAPEPTQYAKRVLYRAYDVTAQISQGPNVLGLTVADGWYAGFEGRFAWGSPPRRVLAQLVLDFSDGSRQVLGTGPGWRARRSGLEVSEIKIGEVYDARLEPNGWDRVGFDDHDWPSAEVADTPSCRLAAHISPPIRIVETLKPHTISTLSAGVHRVDFGRVFSGACRVRVRGRAGSRIELRYAELLKPDGEIDQSNMQDPTGEPKRDVFILKGDPAGETFQSQFCYRGFRYVRITGMEHAPSAQWLEGLFMHTDLPTTGSLRSSVPLIEQIWQNIQQTQKSNLVGIPTDNAIRELRGWTMDGTKLLDTGSLNMDVCAFAARYLQDIVDDQSEEGVFPEIAPSPRFGNAANHPRSSAPGWGSGAIVLPWMVWQRYGDVSLIERHWEAMNRHVQFVLTHNPDYIWRHERGNDYGDWLGLVDTSKDLVGTGYWAHTVDLLAQMAGAVGRNEDEPRLRKLFEHIRAAFNESFVKSDGTVGEGSQTAYVLALHFGLLPGPAQEAAAQRLAADIRDRRGSLTTGTLGTQYVLEVLAQAGFSELAYDLLLRTEYPSWGYMVGHGATSIWETWQGHSGHQGNWVAQNQYALGAIGGFLFHCLAGIDAAAPGYERIIIRPRPDRRVPGGGGDVDSVMGRISTQWTGDPNGGFTLNVTLPPNTTAQVHVPAPRGARVTEGGGRVNGVRDIRLVERNEHELVVEVGSGHYHFAVEVMRQEAQRRGYRGRKLRE